MCCCCCSVIVLLQWWSCVLLVGKGLDGGRGLPQCVGCGEGAGGIKLAAAISNQQAGPCLAVLFGRGCLEETPGEAGGLIVIDAGGAALLCAGAGYQEPPGALRFGGDRVLPCGLGRPGGGRWLVEAVKLRW